MLLRRYCGLRTAVQRLFFSSSLIIWRQKSIDEALGDFIDSSDKHSLSSLSGAAGTTSVKKIIASSNKLLTPERTQEGQPPSPTSPHPFVLRLIGTNSREMSYQDVEALLANLPETLRIERISIFLMSSGAPLAEVLLEDPVLRTPEGLSCLVRKLKETRRVKQREERRGISSAASSGRNQWDWFYEYGHPNSGSEHFFVKRHGYVVGCSRRIKLFSFRPGHVATSPVTEADAKAGHRRQLEFTEQFKQYGFQEAALFSGKSARTGHRSPIATVVELVFKTTRDAIDFARNHDCRGQYKLSLLGIDEDPLQYNSQSALRLASGSNKMNEKERKERTGSEVSRGNHHQLKSKGDTASARVNKRGTTSALLIKGTCIPAGIDESNRGFFRFLLTKIISRQSALKGDVSMVKFLPTSGTTSSTAKEVEGAVELETNDEVQCSPSQEKKRVVLNNNQQQRSLCLLFNDVSDAKRISAKLQGTETLHSDLLSFIQSQLSYRPPKEDFLMAQKKLDLALMDPVDALRATRNEGIRSIFAGGIPFETPLKDVKMFFRRFGEVESVSRALKGFFVHYHSPFEAKRAVNQVRNAATPTTKNLTEDKEESAKEPLITLWKHIAEITLSMHTTTGLRARSGIIRVSNMRLSSDTLGGRSNRFSAKVQEQKVMKAATEFFEGLPMSIPLVPASHQPEKSVRYRVKAMRFRKGQCYPEFSSLSEAQMILDYFKETEVFYNSSSNFFTLDKSRVSTEEAKLPLILEPCFDYVDELSDSVYVEGISSLVPERSIQDFFSRYGEVKRIQRLLPENPREDEEPTVLVQFSLAAEAKLVLGKVHGSSHFASGLGFLPSRRYEAAHGIGVRVIPIPKELIEPVEFVSIHNKDLEHRTTGGSFYLQKLTGIPLRHCVNRETRFKSFWYFDFKPSIQRCLASSLGHILNEDVRKVNLFFEKSRIKFKTEETDSIGGNQGFRAHFRLRSGGDTQGTELAIQAFLHEYCGLDRNEVTDLNFNKNSGRCEILLNSRQAVADLFNRASGTRFFQYRGIKANKGFNPFGIVYDGQK